MHLYIKFLDDVDNIKVIAPVEYVKDYDKDKSYKIGDKIKLFWSANEEETPDDVLKQQNCILDSYQLPKVSKGAKAGSSRAAYYPAEILFIAETVKELEQHIDKKRIHVPTFKKSAQQQVKEQVPAVSTKNKAVKKPISDTKNFEKLAEGFDRIVSSDEDGKPLKSLFAPKEVKNTKDNKKKTKKKHRRSSESSTRDSEEELVSSVEFRVQIFTLQSELKAAKAKVEDITKDLSSANEKLRRKRKECSTLTDDNEDLKKQVSKLSKENDELRGLNLKYQHRFMSSSPRAGPSYRSPLINRFSPMKMFKVSPSNKTSVSKRLDFGSDSRKLGSSEKPAKRHAIDNDSNDTPRKIAKKPSGGSHAIDNDSNDTPRKIAKNSSSSDNEQTPRKRANKSPPKTPGSPAGYAILTEEEIEAAGLTTNGKEASNSLFVKNLALEIFGSKVLLSHSVQGKACNRLKKKQDGKPKPPLPKKGLIYLKGLFKQRLITKGVCDEADQTRELSKVGFYITEKMGSLRRTEVPPEVPPHIKQAEEPHQPKPTTPKTKEDKEDTEKNEDEDAAKSGNQDEAS